MDIKIDGQMGLRRSSEKDETFDQDGKSKEL